ncbi:ATP-binding protein [Brevundimonas sp. SL130]|uniref:ATP-binding protein n=1 Tax=Brevundimonas sp. SL130 TaxID=2995143 RepID=UPI00226D2CD3|nr:ATP-binding protein [Brevundimonas sp. SL130]WAC58809.1 ATP-binding protein [Brevundimonas sp. SL130]
MTISVPTARLRALIQTRAARSALAMLATMTAMVAVLLLVVWANLSTLNSADESVRHTAMVERAAANLLTAALDQETGVRGYVESGGDGNFLPPYIKGQQKFSDELQTLSRLTLGNPSQKAQLDGVRTAMETWRTVYAEPRLSSLSDKGADPVLAIEGQVAMDELRRRLEALRAQEAAMTLEREGARNLAYATARVTIVAVGMAALGFGAGMGLWAVRTTDRREREVLAFAKSKTRMLAIVSHEIRTPLNGMLGMLQVMAGEPMDPAQKQRLEVALESGETLTSLLNDLLDASKIEAGRLELVEADFDLARLLDRMKAAFGEVAHKKGVALRIEVTPDAAGDWIGDKVRIGQILANLISNAVKFTARGEVLVAVSASGAGGLRVDVRDSGIGMDETAVGRLFAPYVQASAETSHTHGGTGLGLSISRSLARMMGGDITVESTAGQGSCFTVQLPLERGRASTSEADSAPSLAGLRVLAADDNAVNRKVLATILPNLGMEVTVVEDGDQAVAAWRDDSYDMVLLDLRMPVCDGFEATRRIRAEEADGRRTPLILLSGDVSASVRDQGREAGLDGFVAKPLDVHALIEAMSAALPPARPLAA